MRVLVTGGAGYLGSIFCEVLLAAGHSVVVLDRLLFNQHSLFHLAHHPNFEFVLGDARDQRALLPLVNQVDAIVPLAAVVGAPACDRDPWLALTTNVEAIELLLSLRSEEQLIVYPNTNSGYGASTGEQFCTEDTPLEPISLYGRTKCEAEMMVLEAPNTITFRLATVFGASPRMRLDLLVNHFAYAAVTDGSLVMFEKDFKRNFVHVRDVADAFLHALTHPEMAGQAYNLGLDSANLSKWELAMKVKEQVPKFYVHEAAVGEDPDKRNYIVSSARLKAAGFEAQRGLEAGITELLKLYRMLGRAPFKNV